MTEDQYIAAHSGGRRTADFDIGKVNSRLEREYGPACKVEVIDETPELEALLTRLISTAEELARAEARLAGFAGRLGGPVIEPTGVSVDGLLHTGGFANRLEGLNSSLSTTLIDINSTISRLERLA